MDKLSFAEALGKKIITSQQNSFEAGNDLEDISHITNIKRIILAISDYLKSDHTQRRTYHEKRTRDLFVYGSGWLKTGGDFHFGKP
ncbi:MAG: hypothetical protein KAT27_05285 [Desulfobacterales bacterium]|nr:hypothetical protein [Desulfobacterales bacterium]